MRRVNAPSATSALPIMTSTGVRIVACRSSALDNQQLNDMATKPNEARNWLLQHVGYVGNDCLKWPYSGNWNGYGHLGWEGKIVKAHRLMCQLAHGAPPTNKHVAAHTCNNGHNGCVNPGHLRWKTPRENLIDRRSAGTLTKKRWTNRGSLTDDQVAEIMQLRGKLNQRQIGERFGISYQHVSVIQNGKLKRQKSA